MAACNPLMVKGKFDYLFARIKSVLPCSSSMEDPVVNPIADPVVNPIDSPIAKTILAPANTAEASEGGEWQELMAVLNNWLGAGKASQIWEQSQRPLKAAGLAIVLLILLQLLGAVLGTLNHIPMLPRLLELVEMCEDSGGCRRERMLQSLGDGHAAPRAAAGAERRAPFRARATPAHRTARRRTARRGQSLPSVP